MSRFFGFFLKFYLIPQSPAFFRRNCPSLAKYKGVSAYHFSADSVNHILFRSGTACISAGVHVRACSGLTACLKDEVLRRGAVPFYGTAQSHIVSLNTARRAGFRPAWAEVWAKPL